jgi:hypothetical protein
MQDNPLTAAEQIFLEVYRTSLDEISEAPADLNRIFIFGGRGLGKSIVLRELKNRAEGPVELIDGRKHAQALEMIDPAKKGPTIESGHCFFDDIDHFILMARLLRREDEFDEILRTLLRFMTGFPDKKRLIVTSTLAPIRLNEVIYQNVKVDAKSELRWGAYSLFLQSFHPLPLSPWQGDWRSELVGIINRHFDGSVDRTVLDVCEQVILELTGGHPSLFASALNEMKRIFTGERLRLIDRRLSDMLKGRDPKNDAVLRELLSRHLEDHILDIGLSPILLTIRSLQNSERHHAFEALKALARKPGWIPPVDSRKILQDEGLIYASDESGEYVIPGVILRRAIEQEDSEPPEGKITAEKAAPSIAALEPKTVAPQLWVEPDPYKPSENGLLVIQDVMKRREIAFSGGPWAILRTLLQDPTRTFSLEELRKPPLTKEPAVRSAIQRLQAKLTKEGLHGVVENIYGQGYRRGEALSLRFSRPAETSTGSSEG